MCTQGKENILKPLWKDLLKHSKDTVLDLAYKKLLISMLVEDVLPDIKKQINHNVIGWVGQLLNIIQVATQFFKELKTTVLVLQI